MASIACSLFFRAVRSCGDADVSAFFAQPSTVVAALELEAWITTQGRSVLCLFGQPRSDFGQELWRRKAYFHNDLNETEPSISLSTRDAIEWLCTPRQVDNVTVSDLLPFTIGYLFLDLANQSIRANDANTLEMLLTSPTFVEFFSDEERAWTLATVMHNIGLHGTRDSVNVLVAHGADVDGDKRVTQVSPLWMTGEKRGSNSLACLVENGATTVGLCGVLSRASMSSAKTAGRHLSDLLCLGLDVHTDCALHTAACYKNPELVRVLVTEGFADLDARDAKGQTPLLLAVAESDHVLFSPWATPHNVAAIERLLSFGANINAQDDQGRSALHLAPLRHHSQVFELLLARGADPNHADHKGRTPLHYVGEASCGMKRIAMMLLEKGANLQARAVDGSTPLLTLISGSYWGRDDELLETAEYLLERGADPNAADNNGTTSLQLCRERQRVRDRAFVRVLTAFGADKSRKS